MQPDVARIIDANLNRAREGLRVVEEHVRFVLNDELLTRHVKEMRHALTEATAAFGTDALLGARDVQNDVGTVVSTSSELRRESTNDVARAAVKRLSESLRCIEEYGKIDAPAAASLVERIRYECYSLEQSIFVDHPLHKRLFNAVLHVLVTELLCKKPWLTVCEEVLRGGATVLQLREKSLPDRELLDRACALRELTLRYNALLIINDRPDIAKLCEADGVHVGQDDLNVADARRIAGPRMLIGRSTHNMEEATAALAESPDYIAVGPMFASETKPEVKVRGLDLLQAVLTEFESHGSHAGIPVVAIGGINTTRAALMREELSRRGLHNANVPVQLAVCQAVIGADDPAGAVQAILASFRLSKSDKPRAEAAITPCKAD